MAAVGPNHYTSTPEATENPGALIKYSWENEMKVELPVKLETVIGYHGLIHHIDIILLLFLEPRC